MREDNLFVAAEARSEWEKARAAATIQEILSLFSGRSLHLLPFDEVKHRLRLTQVNYRGLQEIELDRIRGSVGRYRDFTRTFLPRKDEMAERWQRVRAAAVTGGVPPIEVYQVGEVYFVLDGNHRVSVARQAGARTIQAHVWEYTTPAGLSARADLDEVLIKAEYLEFLEHTRLDRLRPDHHIVFTTPGRYRELEYQIALYQKALEQIDGEPISYEEAAAAWYDMIYTPAVTIIREQGALERFPGRTEADLFVWIWRYHRELQARGRGTLAETLDRLKRGRLLALFARWWNRLSSPPKQKE